MEPVHNRQNDCQWCVLWHRRYRTTAKTLESKVKFKYTWTLSHWSLSEFLFHFRLMVFIFGTMISYDMCMTRHASEHRYDIGVKVKVKVLKMCLSARNTHASFTLRWGGGLIWDNICLWCVHVHGNWAFRSSLRVKRRVQIHLKSVLKHVSFYWRRLFIFSTLLLWVCRWQERFQITAIAFSQSSRSNILKLWLTVGKAKVSFISWRRLPKYAPNDCSYCFSHSRSLHVFWDVEPDKDRS